TTYVDNYPGFPNGIGGVKLMMDMQAQVKNLGVEIRNGNVAEVRQTGNETFLVHFDNGDIIEGKAVIVGTGAKAKWTGVNGEQEMIGKGVSGCATCDGMFFRDKIMAVIGGGDTACEDAGFLAKFASKVYMIHRRDQFRASAIEQKKIFDNEKIEIIWNTEVKEIMGSGKVEGIKIFNNKTNEEKVMAVDGVFVAIGHEPATGFVKEIVELKETGHIKTGFSKEYKTMTSKEGIFAAGDCVDDIYRQAIAAAGDGCKAGLDADRWLSNKK
ncbi:MAG TPA: FAD-dependent oxidoreductase, partial [Patescibacteria group bacterium]